MGHAAVVEILLKAGANVHASNDSALVAAAKAGHATVVEILLKAGADVHANNDSALVVADKARHATVVKILLEAGADGLEKTNWYKYICEEDDDSCYSSEEDFVVSVGKVRRL